MDTLIYKILLLVLVFKKSVICFNLDDKFPIIYEDPADQKNSYFGYSVILGPTTGSTNEKLDSWILIGAPRGNSSYNAYKSFKEPGIVFRCKFKGKCAENVDFTRSSSDHAWIGAAMDIDKDLKNYAVCGHRWIKTSKKNHFLLGACYLSIDKKISSTVPLIKEESVSSHGELVYGMAQAGISVHFTKQNELVLGAPGIYLWHGIPLYFDNAISAAQSKKSVKAVFQPNVAADSFSYQGYQVASGKFFSQNKLLYVASAPKSDKYKGKVVLYDLNTFFQQLVPHDRYTILRGEQIGSYFGASLAVTDINSDNLDDLIIGAPFYSQDWDEGRVYVYLGSNYDFNPNVQKLDGFTPGGRFGTSLMALGDINGDGYKDLAVGAPYGEDQGAVYIYNGQKSEPYLKLSQKLVAKNIYSGLNGFGISISRPADVDNNKYSDIAVGAHKSGHVVIFRTKPVIKLTSTLSTSKSSLSFTDNFFNITICQSYSGHNLPDSIEVISVLAIDSKLVRFYIQGKSTKDFVYERKINITVTSTNCEKITVIKKDGVKDFEHPIFISLKQNLTQDIKEKSVIVVKRNGDVIGQDNFNKVKPVLSSDSQFKTYAQIPFSKGCQSEKCNVTLQLQLGISNANYTIGSGGIIEVSVAIKNIGETAYPVEVSVNSPFDKTRNLAIICPENTNHNLTSESCVFFNPFDNGHSETAIIKIDMSQFDMLNKSESLIFEFVTISGHEPNPKFKKGTKINFVYDANLILTGKPKQEIYLLGGNESVKEIEFQQIYTIEKFGQSNVAKINLIIDIPTSVDGVSFHQLNYNGKLNKQNFHCDYSSELTLKKEMPKISNLDDTSSLKRNINKRSTNNQKSSANQTTTGVSQVVDLPLARTLFLNCSDNTITCSRLSCHIGPFMDTNGATLQLQMKLNISEILKKLIQTKDIIYFSTNGSINEQRSKSATVATTFNIGFEKEKLDWIKTTIFSVLISIMILIVVTGILMKAGFFQRKKKEEMEKFREQMKEAEITRESHFEEIYDGTNEMKPDNSDDIKIAHQI